MPDWIGMFQNRARHDCSKRGQHCIDTTQNGRSAVVSPAIKKQFYKELQTPFLIENKNKNNRTIEIKQQKIIPCFQKTSSIKGGTLLQNVEEDINMKIVNIWKFLEFMSLANAPTSGQR